MRGPDVNFWGGPCKFFTYSGGNFKIFGGAMTPPRSQVAPPLDIIAVVGSVFSSHALFLKYAEYMRTEQRSCN